jgi:hypothetical protein
MAKREVWNTISLNPLTGIMDTRSRPADVPLGGFRWKQNWAVSTEGKLFRRPGFQIAFSDLVSASSTPQTLNYDFRNQNGDRELPTFLFESTSSEGIRHIFIGTQSGVWVLDEATGLWTAILSGLGASGTRWHAAELQNMVLFTNNEDAVRSYNLKTGGVLTVTALSSGCDVTAAAVIVQYNAFMMVMNVVADNERQGSRVMWSDINLPETWQDAVPNDGNLGGFQDLEYGDDILAAAPLLGALYIFTRRSIWRMMPSGDSGTVFAFTKVYSEQKNQAGCIAFPNTLVSDGENLYYMGRDGIYRYSPYIPVPERTDWIHRADGLIYRSGLTTTLDGDYCLSPVAEYLPASRELWFSWPGMDQHELAAAGINNYTLICQTEQKTADVVDHGFTALANYRRTPASAQKCNEVQDFLGVSGTDWTLKSIGGVYYRQIYDVVLDDNGLPTPDIQLTEEPADVGYYSILRGMIPLGLTDREKKVRRLLMDHDTSDEDTPCVMQLRIGNSRNLVDPNEDRPTCSPQWRIVKYDGANGVTNPPLRCPNQVTLATMATKGLRPAQSLAWPCQEKGTFLYYELKVMNEDGAAGVGGDVFLQRIDFDATAMPKT